MINKILNYINKELETANNLLFNNLSEADMAYFNGQVDTLTEIKNKIEEIIHDNQTSKK